MRFDKRVLSYRWLGAEAFGKTLKFSPWRLSLNKDGSTDPLFPVIKDQTQFSVAHARYSKNPIARWHICQGSINSIAFSTDGTYIATVGRDVTRISFDQSNEYSVDGKYVLTGGEDDLVQVWSIEDRKVVAWGEGHNSWVSGVAFDSYWSPPNSDGSGENVIYRFVSAGQDTQLLFWDLELDEIIVPLRRAPGGSPTFSAGNQSSHWDIACPVGTLQPAPSMRDVPKLSPVVAHRVHIEPLSGLILTQESIITLAAEMDSSGSGRDLGSLKANQTAPIHC
ncbi:transducin/WD40 repeat-like superfamily protein [Actinidia rufa]|uniref:Transducin/WD40 repeat-like superfamily protein n=1 Tax=Actinidia rufa TaxID=165716 RepID=A0A7J0GTY9_9ERIC|nr:transducin/WD40 repeat-like superfamily protein [Actinidia rufa]